MPSPPVLALYDSVCPQCGQPIIADEDFVVKTTDGDWVHEDCSGPGD